jgi:hypothetical protein
LNVFVLRRPGGLWVNGVNVIGGNSGTTDIDINTLSIGGRLGLGAEADFHWFGAWNRALTELQIKDLTGKLQRSINEI